MNKAPSPLAGQNHYKLYTILYGSSSPDRKAQHNFMGPVDFHDLPMPLDFFVWVAVSKDRVILVDSGADKETCERRGHNFYRCPTEGLAALGITPESVTDVIVTHMHWDHLGNLEKFPNAHIHVHKAEMAHATGCAMCHPTLRRPYDVDQVCSVLRALYAGRVSFTDEPADIAPGVRVLPVGGHTAGLQVVQVATERGDVILASDAMHFYANGDLTNPYPVIVDVLKYLSALSMLKKRAQTPDHIIPGHDPLVRDKFPPVPGTEHIWDISLPPLI